MLGAVPDKGFTYSLLRAYQPVLYERHGWAPLDQELVRAELPPVSAGSATITPFTEGDLPEVMRLYEETNAERTGPTIRSPRYWRAQLQWLQEDRDGFLVARSDDGVLVGYVPSRMLQRFLSWELKQAIWRSGGLYSRRRLRGAVAGYRDTCHPRSSGRCS